MTQLRENFQDDRTDKSGLMERKFAKPNERRLLNTFLAIQEDTYLAMKHSRLYSYYRIVHACVTSVSFCVTIFLIQNISPLVIHV